MPMSDAIELNWWQIATPTSNELYLSGGLLVEDWPHARQVARLSAQLFEATQPLHKLGANELRILERAAFLHNAGMLVEARRHHKHSFRLIKDAHLPDFSEKQRYEIAVIARYHRRALPSDEHEEFAALNKAARKRVSALSALLRIADALDFSHDGRVLGVFVEPKLSNEKVWTFVLLARPLSELENEIEHANEKADLFEKVFDHKVRFLVQE